MSEQKRYSHLAAKGTILFGKKPKSLEERLLVILKASEIISYIVAANLKFNDKKGRNLYDFESYGDVHQQKVVIDTKNSPVLVSLKKLLDFLYGAYNNDLKKVQPNLSFRRLSSEEIKRSTPFDLGLSLTSRPIKYRLVFSDKKLWGQTLKDEKAVCVFSAARLKLPLSQRIGNILGKRRETVVVGGPGAAPGNIMVNTAKTAKKLGSSVGFITTEYLFKRQRSIRIKPDFVVVARSINERAYLMYDCAHILLVLTGGVAVVEELFIAIYHNIEREISNMRKKPILLWNRDGHWDTLYSFLKVLGVGNEVEIVKTERELLKYLV